MILIIYIDDFKFIKNKNLFTIIHSTTFLRLQIISLILKFNPCFYLPYLHFYITIESPHHHISHQILSQICYSIMDYLPIHTSYSMANYKEAETMDLNQF